MKRNIVEINDEKCNGCGACANACHEGAIEMVNGKAKLINDSYCDGLGACLPHCPTGAISVIERESSEFDAMAVSKKLGLRVKQGVTASTGCPGSAARLIQQVNHPLVEKPGQISAVATELSQWPVQLKLVNVNAPYFQNCDLLVAADCTAFAYANFHTDFIRGRITLIGCPKLDDNIAYAEKLTRLFAENSIRSIIVVRMEVPCCGGIVQAVKQALLANSLILPYREVVIAVDGRIIN